MAQAHSHSQRTLPCISSTSQFPHTAPLRAQLCSRKGSAPFPGSSVRRQTAVVSFTPEHAEACTSRAWNRGSNQSAMACSRSAYPGGSALSVRVFSCVAGDEVRRRRSAVPSRRSQQGVKRVTTALSEWCVPANNALISSIQVSGAYVYELWIHGRRTPPGS